MSLQLNTKYLTKNGRYTVLVTRVSVLNPKWWKGARFRDFQGVYRTKKGKVLGASSDLLNIYLPFKEN